MNHILNHHPWKYKVKVADGIVAYYRLIKIECTIASHIGSSRDKAYPVWNILVENNNTYFMTNKKEWVTLIGLLHGSL